MGKKKQKEENIWYQRKITLLYLIVLVIVVMVMIMAVRSIVSYVESNNIFSSEESNEKYDNKYNASRFFFRLYYPDNWHVNTETHGFWLNEEQHLVLELFPMVKVVHTQAPTATPAAGTGDVVGDRLAGMVRDESLTASFYYYAYTDEQKQWIEDHPSNVPVLSEELTELENQTDLKLLDKIGGDVYNAMTSGFDRNLYTYTELSVYETRDITFKYFTYQYKNMGIDRTADVYVAVRSGNYYVIIYDGISSEEENAYRTHKNAFLSILEEFRFSVFDD